MSLSSVMLLNRFKRLLVERIEFAAKADNDSAEYHHHEGECEEALKDYDKFRANMKALRKMKEEILDG